MSLNKYSRSFFHLYNCLDYKKNVYQTNFESGGLNMNILELVVNYIVSLSHVYLFRVCKTVFREEESRSAIMY